jgi:hypothetical protein
MTRLLEVAKPMLKKVLLAALLALSFYISTAGTRAEQPPPKCDPCPWVN